MGKSKIPYNEQVCSCSSCDNEALACETDDYGRCENCQETHGDIDCPENDPDWEDEDEEDY